MTATSEFVLGAKGVGEVAQHRADISDREGVLAGVSLFASRSDLSTRGALVPLPTPVSRVDPFPPVSKATTNPPPRTMHVVRRLGVYPDRRRAGGTLSGSQRREGFLSRWTTATPRHPFRIG